MKEFGGTPSQWLDEPAELIELMFEGMAGERDAADIDSEHAAMHARNRPGK